jgi:hypothetical protein
VLLHTIHNDEGQEDGDKHREEVPAALDELQPSAASK